MGEGVDFLIKKKSPLDILFELVLKVLAKQKKINSIQKSNDSKKNKEWKEQKIFSYKENNENEPKYESIQM